ncbi:MAG TPA: DUF177 domain-containing protein [Firmicutes bacterium]|jgi:uncharacterized protein|nr:DUF177 domain-containing protein [Bacillota bacterium]
MEPIFQVDLTAIKDLPGARIEVQGQITLPSLNWEGNRLLEFINPWQISLAVTNVKRGYQVDGKLSGSYRINCDRCLEKVKADFSSDFNDLFLPEAPLPEEEAKIFTGDELDLTATIMETINLQMPLKTLCLPNCRGLCPVCGSNLNHETCLCPQEDFDPRLAVLLKWKQEKGGGNDG